MPGQTLQKWIRCQRKSLEFLLSTLKIRKCHIEASKEVPDLKLAHWTPSSPQGKAKKSLDSQLTTSLNQKVIGCNLSSLRDPKV
ncbi:Hypothetical predicted protein [Xyrichtys novacula]|uniref:Uncharacterized protein n=1 Tax=Xyrichtys novacula TaxID=13765 RepID=A0AAV1F4V6_XYRNO|nr:Hypothetical predicted protein [Xyrichtys novacula]